MAERVLDDTGDRPTLRRRLRDEALTDMLNHGKGGVSLAELMLLSEAVATTMLEHPEWPDE